MPLNSGLEASISTPLREVALPSNASMTLVGTVKLAGVTRIGRCRVRITLSNWLPISCRSVPLSSPCLPITSSRASDSSSRRLSTRSPCRCRTSGCTTPAVRTRCFAESSIIRPSSRASLLRFSSSAASSSSRYSRLPRPMMPLRLPAAGYCCWSRTCNRVSGASSCRLAQAAQSQTAAAWREPSMQANTLFIVVLLVSGSSDRRWLRVCRAHRSGRRWLRWLRSTPAPRPRCPHGGA